MSWSIMLALNPYCCDTMPHSLHNILRMESLYWRLQSSRQHKEDSRRCIFLRAPIMQLSQSTSQK